MPFIKKKMPVAPKEDELSEEEEYLQERGETMPQPMGSDNLGRRPGRPAKVSLQAAELAVNPVELVNVPTSTQEMFRFKGELLTANQLLVLIANRILRD